MDRPIVGKGGENFTEYITIQLKHVWKVGNAECKSLNSKDCLVQKGTSMTIQGDHSA